MGVRKHNWETIKAMFLSGRTAREIGILMGIHPAQILNKSKDEGWGALRKQLKALPPTTFKAPEPKIEKRSGAGHSEVGFAVEPAEIKNKLDCTPVSNDAFSRALRLRSSDTFRERVISQADKALSTLENAVVNNVYETDRFAEALTKIERIGARAYGYDRENEHPIINIGILGSGAEYEST